jgi:glycosyltransferase involved in cell wall biosynthesis
MKNKLPSVLVVIIYTDYKSYCKKLMPQIFDMLTYKNKTLLYVTPENCPELRTATTGEEVCSIGRNFGYKYATKHNFDYVFQLDHDCEPEPDALQRLTSTSRPLVGGLLAHRGNPWEVIGHRYSDRNLLTRVPLRRNELQGVVEVDGASGGYLLIARSIFSKVNLDDYTGPDIIPYRHTAEDEYYQIKIYNKLGIRPSLLANLKSWHYDADGFKYRNFGETKQWLT